LVQVRLSEQAVRAMTRFFGDARFQRFRKLTVCVTILLEMKIYFAGAIRGGRQDAALYYEIVEQLQKHGEF
jgi:hypothetical protein